MRWPARAFWIKSTCAVLALVAGAEYVRTNYRLGLPGQVAGCLPHSVFLVSLGDTKVQRGDYVAFKIEHLPPFPDGATFVKQLAAVPGDRIDVGQGEVRVNGEARGTLDLVEALHVPAATFDRHEVVPAGQFFLMGTLPRSYDSRYWGYVPAARLIGKARALW